MGNHLATASAVNVTDVSSSLRLVAPLGCEHRNYFRSFRCTKIADPSNSAESLSSRTLFFSGRNRYEKAPSTQPQSQWASSSTDVVVKVFVRTLGDNRERELVEFCYDHLLGIDARMTPAQVIPGVSQTPTRPQREEPPCNVLFYSAMEVHNDRFCKLERPYIAFSLAERLATRPYWNMAERLFAGYQLLQSLVQLHERWETVHGDLKTDNVMVNSYGWIYVTDLSPFKPALLPAHNPALFDHFYDTNETRICYLAPEKFVEESIPLSTLNVNATRHTKAMDIFSAACVLAHIVTEEPLFSLSEVLSLRSLQTQEELELLVDKALTERGVPVCVGHMLRAMLCTSAEDRPTARALLEDFTPEVFPPYFAFIYYDILPVLLSRPPDHQAQLLYSRLEDILAEAERRCHPTSMQTAEGKDFTVGGGAKQSTVLLLLPVVVNASLHAMMADSFSRLVCVIQKMLPYCPTEVQKETILPYVLHYVGSGKFPDVARVLALRTLATICHCIPFSVSDSTMFDALILPCIEDLVSSTSSRNTALMVELADQLPGFLLLARAFLEQHQAVVSVNVRGPTFGGQLNDLLERGWDVLRSLYKHTHANVVVALLHRTVDVVRFLGEERTQDDLIPFLTTAIASTIDVQRELFPQAINCHLCLQGPKLKTLRLFIDEGLRQTDITCLKRTIDSITAIVNKKCLPVEDVMPLVHQALPQLLSCNEWVCHAVCSLVETVVRTHRLGDVWMYLECALCPMLRYKVPLAHIASFPAAVRLELSHSYRTIEEQMGKAHSTVRVLGGDGDSRNRLLHRMAMHEPIYTLPLHVTKRSLRGLGSYVALVDVSYDPHMVDTTMFTRENKETLSEDDHHRDCVTNDNTRSNSVSWKLLLKPTSREYGRLSLRESTQGAENTSEPSFNMESEKQNPVEGFYATGRRQRNVGGSSTSMESTYFPISNVIRSEKEVNPVAAPWFTQDAHLGGIYCSAATTRGGTLVTAGGCGDAVLWSIGKDGVDYTHRIRTEASATCTFLFTNILREGLSPLLCMGGTDGECRLYDLLTNNILMSRRFDGSALTAASSVDNSIILVSTALGGLFALDHRTRKDVWRSALSASLGSPSGISPLFYDSRAYGASVVTLGGGVALFDLRFQLLLQQYHLTHDASQEMDSVNEPHAIVCVAPDIPSTTSLDKSRHPGLLLGTKSGTVYRMDLSTGDSNIAFQPATRGKAIRSLLVQPKHGVVLTAGDDMWIRKWVVTTPGKSKTLVSPPYTSPGYMETTRGSISELQTQRPYGSVAHTTGSELYFEDPSSINYCWSNNNKYYNCNIDRGSTTLRSSLWPPRHHEDAILTMCLASNGEQTYLASGSRDGTLTLWFNGA